MSGWRAYEKMTAKYINPSLQISRTRGVLSSLRQYSIVFHAVRLRTLGVNIRRQSRSIVKLRLRKCHGVKYQRIDPEASYPSDWTVYASAVERNTGNSRWVHSRAERIATNDYFNDHEGHQPASDDPLLPIKLATKFV